MPKIKTLNKSELEKYLNAYKHKLNQSTDDKKAYKALQEKVSLIEKSLNERAILGLEDCDEDQKKTKKSLLNIFKSKK